MNEVSLDITDYKVYFSLEETLKNKTDDTLQDFINLSNQNEKKLDATIEKLNKFIEEASELKKNIINDREKAKKEKENIIQIDVFYEKVVEVKNVSRYLQDWTSKSVTYVGVELVQYKRKKIYYKDGSEVVATANRDDNYRIMFDYQEFPWSERKQATELAKKWAKENNAEIVKKK